MFITTLLVSFCAATPSSPSEIVFPEYVFTPPVSEEFKEVILDDIPVFIAEDQELPLINLVATFRGGRYLDNPKSVGLTGMMASLVRDGGTESMSAEELDEKFAFLAAGASVRAGGSTTTASLNSLSSNFEESFDLFLDMLQHPGFQQSRIHLKKADMIEGMKQRNDYPSSILGRENSSVLFGDSYLGREVTKENIDSITEVDLRSKHKAIINPSNLILSVSGDFDKDEMLLFLTEKLSGWERGDVSDDPPDVISDFDPGVYYVDRDVPQGGVRISLRSFRRDDSDAEAAVVMNYILGGGGFSSRITQKVRSDEGLAYSAGSQFSAGVWSDGVWSAGFESKNSTVALAAKLVFDEVNRIKTELVSEEDLSLAKSAIIEQFPSNFQSKAGTLSVFVSDDLSKRDPQYWSNFRNKIGAITAEDVMDVASRVLRPEDMAVVIVGNWDEINKGDAGGRATIGDIKDIVGGDIVELPLRDPLTLKVVNE